MLGALEDHPCAGHALTEKQREAIGWDMLHKLPELTVLEMAKKKPLPFPPEPAAWLGVKMMTWAMLRADRREGKRGLFLRTRDAIGMGFDS